MKARKKNRTTILRRAILFAFGLAFITIWLPRTFPSQALISLLWPIYHWYGVAYYFRFIDAPGILVGSTLLGLSTLLVRDYLESSRAVRKIPTRIHVTGIRGKTTTTRLIGAALRHTGLRVVTKTTGKDARLTDERAVEHEIRDHHEQPNLREQPRIITDMVANGGADAIVFECMSIRPKNIEAESRYVRPTISVITNVRADHLDVMGPTLEDVAWTLSGIIPFDGTVVTAEKKYLPIIMKRAEERRAKVIEVDEGTVPDDLLPKFPYMIFKENIAITLAVCSQLGISAREAMDGMLEAKPDPGLTRILDATLGGQSVRLIAAFGVNDVDSTRIVFNELERRGFTQRRGLVGLFHARKDRITRTLEFAESMAKMPFEEIICVGKTTNLFVSVASKEGYPKEKIANWGQVDGDEIFRRLGAAVERRGGPIVLFGCGNMIGIEGFVRKFESRREEGQAPGLQVS
jgi:poly-gamma-glutamate synthase PgsB/CapB